MKLHASGLALACLPSRRRSSPQRRPPSRRPCAGRGAGRSDFDLRVAARLLGVLQREQRQGGAAGVAERVGLPRLLRAHGLADGIAEGRLPADAPSVHTYLWRTTQGRLAIDNPAYRW